MTSRTFNFAPVGKIIYDELHGTGLAFRLVVWRPGLPGGADSVAVVSPLFSDNTEHEAADALRMAAEKV
jgi:hypothetical protein